MKSIYVLMRFGLNKFIGEINLKNKQRLESPTSTEHHFQRTSCQILSTQERVTSTNDTLFKLQLDRGTVVDILSLSSQIYYSLCIFLHTKRNHFETSIRSFEQLLKFFPPVEKGVFFCLVFNPIHRLAVVEETPQKHSLCTTTPQYLNSLDF